MAQAANLFGCDGGEELRKNNKNRDLSCFGCKKILQRDHTGIVCLNSDHLCPDCSYNFVKVVLGDPEKNIPLKCMMCRSKIVVSSFERQLTSKQFQTFLLYNMQFDPTFLGENEMIVSCPFCQYWEINTINDGRLMFLCNKKYCKKTSCFWCKKEIKNRDNVLNEEKV